MRSKRFPGMAPCEDRGSRFGVSFDAIRSIPAASIPYPDVVT
jgi:hypothetical protein